MVRPQHQPLSIVLLFFSLLLVPGMVGEAAAARLSPPANLTVPATDADGRYVLSWTAAATLEGGLTYVLQEASDSAFTGARTILFTTEVSATINGRKSGRTYYYRVRATKSGRKASPWAPGSNGCQVTILAAAPGPLTVPVTDADGSYVVSWEPSATPGVTYVLKEATDSAFTKARTVPHTALLSADISGRKVGRNYYYRVRAIRNGRTASPWTTGGNGCQIADAPFSAIMPLNDTGITWYGSVDQNNLPTPPPGFEGQDADHGRDRLAADGLLVKQGGGEAGFDFTKLDENGNDLPVEAATWSCVRDNHTGLVWEVKTDDGGLRDRDWSYSWYNSDPATNGGRVGSLDPYLCGDVVACDSEFPLVPIPLSTEAHALAAESPAASEIIVIGWGCGRSLEHCNTEAYTEAVNSQGLCGASDWRLPTRQEVQSVVDWGNDGGNIVYFPSGVGGWSSSPYAGSAYLAWQGPFFPQAKSDPGGVSLVRGGGE